MILTWSETSKTGFLATRPTATYCELLFIIPLKYCRTMQNKLCFHVLQLQLLSNVHKREKKLCLIIKTSMRH